MARFDPDGVIQIYNVAIIQARMGSLRFPGKMLATLGGIPILEWVITRLLCADLVDEIVLATSSAEADNALVEIAKKLGIKIFRGSEADVLGRFLGAVKLTPALNIVRICADNPFVDPKEVDKLIRFFLDTKPDYACNHQDRLGSLYADGFGAEIFSVITLEKIEKKTTHPSHREHVTQYIWDNLEEFKINSVPAPMNLSFPHLRFDVDVSSDLEWLSSLVKKGVTITSSAEEIIAIAQAEDRQEETNSSGNELALEMDQYLNRLFPLCRSIAGQPNRETLLTLQEIVPLEIYEIPTGTKVYDWVIPEEWSIRDAWIADLNGNRLVDFQVNNLHVVSYSSPINSVMSWNDLKRHVHVHEELENAIPYRTTYYERNWGFCVTQKQYALLENLSGPFTTVIDSQLKEGSLSYGEYLIPGKSSKEILLSCYICHPSMANDSLSGVILTAFLARYISQIKDRHWSYRVIFVPETIGAIAYCATHEEVMKRIDVGLVITTVGGRGKFSYKQSFEEGHSINRMIEDSLREAGVKFITYPFDIHGSDERQYSSQEFRINIASIFRDRYYEYPYYHSSLDDLNFVNGGQIAKTFIIYTNLIKRLEQLVVYRNKNPQCEVMLSKHQLYPTTGGASRPELGGRSELDLILWLLFLSDGKTDIESIAARVKVDTKSLILIADRLVDKGVLELL